MKYGWINWKDFEYAWFAGVEWVGLVNVSTTLQWGAKSQKKNVRLFLLSYFGLVVLYTLSQYTSFSKSQALMKFLSYLVMEATCLQKLQFPFFILSLLWRSLCSKVLIDSDSQHLYLGFSHQIGSHWFPWTCFPNWTQSLCNFLGSLLSARSLEGQFASLEVSVWSSSFFCPRILPHAISLNPMPHHISDSVPRQQPACLGEKHKDNPTQNFLSSFALKFFCSPQSSSTSFPIIIYFFLLVFPMIWR